MHIQTVPRASVLRFFFFCCYAVFCGVALAGCDLARNQLDHDRTSSKAAQDYRDAMAPRLPEIEDSKAAALDTASIPSLQPYVAETSTNMKTMPLVSVTANQSVPLRDVLFELAEKADYDLELDPRITGSIIFTARERPFDEVVQRIANVAGLRYRFENDVLRVEVDTPYNKLYKVDYLSYIRSNKGNIRNNVAVVTGDGADTGSQYEASTKSEIDFWGELEQNLQQILGGSVSGAMKTKHTPKVTATEQNPNVASVAPTSPDAEGNVQVQPPDAVLNVESLPVDEEEENAGGAGAANATGATFTINKQAGLVNVYATEKAHKEIEHYLQTLRKAVTAQVLIEAKILEVDLNDANTIGIDWSSFDILDHKVDIVFPASETAATATIGNFAATLDTGDFDALVQALSTFGTVKALASPRLTVLNNQSAVLNVATNRVFFDVDIDVTTDADTGRTVDISSDAHNVPEGVLVNVQPSINMDNGTIALAVRPTVTRIVDEKADPAVQFVTASAVPPITGVESNVPELNVQEIDSVIQVRSGQAVVMGGLLQDRQEATDSGVPVISETPIIGSLFKGHTDTIHKSELVIFLKATILQAPEDSVHNTDKDMYRTFSGDRRPLRL